MQQCFFYHFLWHIQYVSIHGVNQKKERVIIFYIPYLEYILSLVSEFCFGLQVKSDFERILIPEALSVIKCLYKDFEEGLAMKKIYESKISLHEVFLEAVPTSFIYTFLFVRAYVGKGFEIEI